MSRGYLPLLVALAFGAAGCATSYGTPVSQSKFGQIREGVSTKADVIRLLGQPTASNINSDGSEVLHYLSGKQGVDAAFFIPIVGPLVGEQRSKRQHIQILVNKKGVVEKSTSTESDTPMTFGTW